MIYECDKCDATLARGAMSCPQCGETFDEPVPMDASLTDAVAPSLSATDPDALEVASGERETLVKEPPEPPQPQPPAPELSGLDSALRGRSAGGPAFFGSGPAFGASGASSPVSAFPSASAPRKKVPAWAWITLSVLVFLVLCVGLAGWAGYTAWMRGAGGEIAFRQHNQAGNQAFGAHDYSKAVDEYSQMIALRPRRMDGYMLRGIVYGSMGRYRDAIADDTTALTLPQGRNVADLYSNRASAETQSGQFAPAIQDLTQSLTLYKQFRRADSPNQIFGYLRNDYQSRAQTYASMHQWAQAEADETTVIQSYAPDPPDFIQRGQARAAQGKNALALADFEQVIRLDPDSPNSYVAESDFLEHSHQYPQLFALWQRARRAFPEGSAQEGSWWGSLGWFQYQSGQIAQAIQSDQKALVIERAQPWVHYNLALCYAAQGSAAKASAAYADALVHSSEADRKAGLKDVADALAKHPTSAVLQQVQQQLSQAQARKTAFPPLVRRPLMARATGSKNGFHESWGASPSGRPGKSRRSGHPRRL